MGNKIANDLLMELGKPTPKEEIKSRKSGGKDYNGNDNYNWKREHKTIDGLMFCGVSILIGEEWVTKWDVGTESTFEKEKGLVSDSFKRACVNWGIARDLYSNKRRDSQVTSPKADNNAPVVGGASTNGASQSNMVSFGKHSGSEWKNVPLDYVEWVSKNMKEPAKRFADEELKRRATQAENVN